MRAAAGRLLKNSVPTRFRDGHDFSRAAESSKIGRDCVFLRWGQIQR